METALFEGEKGSYTGTDHRIPGSCGRSIGAHGVSRDQAVEAPEVEGGALVLLLGVKRNKGMGVVHDVSIEYDTAPIGVLHPQRPPFRCFVSSVQVVTDYRGGIPFVTAQAHCPIRRPRSPPAVPGACRRAKVTTGRSQPYPRHRLEPTIQWPHQKVGSREKRVHPFAFVRQMEVVTTSNV